MSNILFEDYFNNSNGKPFTYKGKEIRLSSKVLLMESEVSVKIEFISINSKWKQGVVLETNGKFEVNAQEISNKIVLWEHTAPKQVEMIIKSKDKLLFVYNVWDTGDGTMHYGHNGGALYTEEVYSKTTYYCNDGQPNDDFNDLIFEIEYL